MDIFIPQAMQRLPAVWNETRRRRVGDGEVIGSLVVDVPKEEDNNNNNNNNSNLGDVFALYLRKSPRKNYHLGEYLD